MRKYKGDSPGKKAARYVLWTDLLKRIQARDSIYKPGEFKIVVLASEEGGDVSCLLGLGVPHENIFAVDQDQEALEKFSQRWPKVHTVHGDIVDAVKRIGKPNIVFLDFCAPLHQTLMKKIRGVAYKVAIGGTLAIAVLKGREQDALEGLHLARPDETLDDLNRPKDLMSRIVVDCLGGNYKSAVAEASKRYDKLYGRILPIAAFLYRIGHKRLALTTAIGYNSGTKDSRGSSMVIAAFKVFRERVPRAKVPLPNYIDFPKITEEELKTLILRLSQSDDKVDLLFNIPKRTVAAWRAHETMGTYSKEVPDGAPNGAPLPGDLGYFYDIDYNTYCVGIIRVRVQDIYLLPENGPYGGGGYWEVDLAFLDDPLGNKGTGIMCPLEEFFWAEEEARLAAVAQLGFMKEQIDDVMRDLHEQRPKKSGFYSPHEEDAEETEPEEGGEGA